MGLALICFKGRLSVIAIIHLNMLVNILVHMLLNMTVNIGVNI